MVSRRSQWFPLVFVALVFAWATPSEAGSQATAPEYVYTSNFGDFTISGFSVNPDTGTLTKLKGSPFPAGVGPTAFAASRNGRFLYLALGEWSEGGPCGNDFAQAVSYAIAPATGELTQLDDVTLPDYCPSDLIVDRTGRFIYVALIDWGYPKVGAIAALTTKGGALAAVDGSPFLSPIQAPAGQGAAIGSLALSHDGTTLYASDPNDATGILIFDRDTSTGALTFREAFDSETPFGPIAITPSGKYLIATPVSGSGLWEYSIGSGGNLTAVPGSPFASPDNNLVTGITISPNGKFAAISEQGGITIQKITPKNGALSLVPGSPFGGYFPLTVTFDPSGKFLYVPGTAYEIDPATGVLTKVGSFKTGNYAWDITAVKQ
ncbi:MAG TPA: beta-propeller fold lactonase family protein [Terriglobales bacterium]|nr:beta-propeller fold lactonase family protein [Terriglobales bacterium]